MAEGYYSSEHRLKAFLFYTVCALQIILLAGCGSDSGEQVTAGDIQPTGSDTASAQFSVQWHPTAVDATPAQAPIRGVITDCGTAGVAFITCDVYDEFNTPITVAGPWPCEDHGATVNRIPPGADRTFVVLGWDATPDEGGAIIYQGHTIAGIDLAVGEVVDVGIIDANSFVPPEPDSTAVYGNRIDLAWEDIAVPSVAGYHIYRNGEAIGDTQSPAYSDTNLASDTEYCYTVSAYDLFGHESAQSDSLCQQTDPMPIYYRDYDRDGYGDPNDSIQAETQPPGYVTDDTDCDDTTDTIHPGAIETCNSYDDNCDGSVDENLTFDDDNDGFTSIGSCQGSADDCDDGNASVNKGAAELCNGVNDDCDDYTPDGSDETWFGAPCDGDDFDLCQEGEYVCNAGKQWCNDTSATNIEICNSIDDDCDGSIDEGLIFSYYCFDADGDDYGNAQIQSYACATPPNYVSKCNDCNDSNKNINPAMPESCSDMVDNDCDGTINEDCDYIY